MLNSSHSKDCCEDRAKIRFRNHPQGQLRESWTGPVATNLPLLPTFLSPVLNAPDYIEWLDNFFLFLACILKWTWSFRGIWLFLLLKLKMKKFLFGQYVIMGNKKVSVCDFCAPPIRETESSTLPPAPNYLLLFRNDTYMTEYRIPIYLFLCLLGRAIQNEGMSAVKN